MTVHWCGSGAGSRSGLGALLQQGHEVCLWGDDPDTGQKGFDGLTDRVASLSEDALREALSGGDVVVAASGGARVAPLARISLTRGAHLVTGGHLTPDLLALDAEARAAGVRIVGEVGLAPGIDHLMAHRLIAEMRAGGHALDPGASGADFALQSWCGTFAGAPNAFRARFASPPVEMLTALDAPAVSIRDFTRLDVGHARAAVTLYTAPLDRPETFEAYPTGDCLALLGRYGFEPGWRVRNLSRGALQLNGWAESWHDVFDQLDALGAAGAARAEAGLHALAERLALAHPSTGTEPDRVVLCVALEVRRNGKASFHKTYVLDAAGDARGSARGRLEARMLCLAVNAVMQREIPVGVTSAPSDVRLVSHWLDDLATQAQRLRIVDHLA